MSSTLSNPLLLILAQTIATHFSHYIYVISVQLPIGLISGGEVVDDGVDHEDPVEVDGDQQAEEDGDDDEEAQEEAQEEVAAEEVAAEEVVRGAVDRDDVVEGCASSFSCGQVWNDRE